MNFRISAQCPKQRNPTVIYDRHQKVTCCLKKSTYKLSQQFDVMKISVEKVKSYNSTCVKQLKVNEKSKMVNFCTRYGNWRTVSRLHSPSSISLFYAGCNQTISDVRYCVFISQRSIFNNFYDGESLSALGNLFSYLNYAT